MPRSRASATRRRSSLVVRGLVAAEPEVVLEYVEVRDAHELAPVAVVDGDVLLALAARVGETRLIDNVTVSVRGAEVHVDRGSRLESGRCRARGLRK